MPYSLSFQVAVSIGGCRVSLVAAAACSRGQLPDPARLGELGGPGHVHAEQVHARRPGRRAGGRAGRAGRRRRWAAGCRRSCSARRPAALQSAMILSKPDAARAAVQVDDDALRAARAGRERGHQRRRAEQRGPPRRPPARLPSVVESSSTLRPGETLAEWRSAQPRRAQCQNFRVRARRERPAVRSRFLHIAMAGRRSVRADGSYQMRPRWARVASISSRWTGSKGAARARGSPARCSRRRGCRRRRGSRPATATARRGRSESLDARVVAVEPAQVVDEPLDRRPRARRPPACRRAAGSPRGSTARAPSPPRRRRRRGGTRGRCRATTFTGPPFGGRPAVVRPVCRNPGALRFGFTAVPGPAPGSAAVADGRLARLAHGV